MIKARSLEATLPAIILICDVFCVSLPEQDTHKKGWVYDNATRRKKTLLLCYVQERYENATQLEFEANNNKESEVDGIPEADQYFFLIIQPQCYNSR